MQAIKKLISTLRAFDKLIDEEFARNPEFARKACVALGQTEPSSKKQKTTACAIPDASGKYEEFNGDREKMREWLELLGPLVCKKIIQKKRFAVGKKLRSDEDMNKLIVIIIDGIERQRKRGSSFLGTNDTQGSDAQ
jgi:hypothetical protein